METTGKPKLPAPPQGAGDWLWEREPLPPVGASSGEKSLPRITVVTPSYNQAQFLEQTIRSVLLQDYPDLEYMIFDGGSSDGSVEIIKKYGAHLAHWESETDRGQSHAINKGFRKATGQIMCWLNSDDFYLPGTLKFVAESLADGTGNSALVGHALKVYADGSPTETLEGRYESRERLLQFWRGYRMHQSSIFWRREVFERVGLLDESQHYIMDFDYWVRIARHFEFTNVNRILSCATYHEGAKTGDDYARYHRELTRQAPAFWGSRLSPAYWRLKLSFARHRADQLLVGRVRWHSSRIIRQAKAATMGRVKS